MNIVDIAQAALCEAGRPDLAIGVHYGESFICHTCDERSESRHYLGRGEG